jgi:hypothetical protein
LAWPEGTFKWFNHQLNSNTNSAIWKQEKQPTTTSNSHTKFAQLLLMRNKQKHYYNTTKELKTLASSNLQYKHPEGYCQFTLNSSYLLLLEVLTFFLGKLKFTNAEFLLKISLTCSAVASFLHS